MQSEGLLPPYFLEFHDARLDSVSLALTGCLDLSFAHICYYCKNTVGDREVWSAQAVLRLHGVCKLDIEGAVDFDDCVGDGELKDSGNNRLELLPIDALGAARSLSLLLAGSGTCINVQMRGAELISLLPIVYMEPAPD
jgi:hypothetical protein